MSIKLTEEDFKKFGFSAVIDPIKKDKSWSHPTLGKFVHYPTYDEFIRGVFNLGFKRAIEMQAPTGNYTHKEEIV